MIAATLLITTFDKSATKWPFDGYVRYPSSGSEGPRRQLRILYHNATEWSRNNPHDHGEWKIRIDDQSLIPIEAWDEDEDRYQQWFHDRYDVMREVVENKSYIRPSWLGSMEIAVPWDDEFQLAHCIVAMRRYWKAKETVGMCTRAILRLLISNIVSTG
ncbi:hypothetical protein BKA67DRAFT_683703 [Truncatella angustata]|uniref:Uncharacterized protein n=1 Tax=Truncatella angustata TaxID=152316 RepID=A0A9P8UE21_9PEZI|nr:uncharacterized protein BKA67DRAFT_683703 [Truncatella angustata]KAH6648215.1 hypothetical protein BKA67DRAFT_683703 [Truncatella angustata]